MVLAKDHQAQFLIISGVVSIYINGLCFDINESKSFATMQMTLILGNFENPSYNFWEKGKMFYFGHFGLNIFFLKYFGLCPLLTSIQINLHTGIQKNTIKIIKMHYNANANANAKMQKSNKIATRFDRTIVFFQKFAFYKSFNITKTYLLTKKNRKIHRRFLRKRQKLCFRAKNQAKHRQFQPQKNKISFKTLDSVSYLLLARLIFMQKIRKSGIGFLRKRKTFLFQTLHQFG